MQLYSQKITSLFLEPSAVTIGNFDGVHIGHCEVFKRLLQNARKLNLKAVVVTLKPHPRCFFSKQPSPQLLTTYDEKKNLIAHLSDKFRPDVLIEQPFDSEFAGLSPEVFFETVLLKNLKIKYLCVGHDFGFGKDRVGSIEIIKNLCQKHSVAFDIVPQYQFEGQSVSSTLVRQLLSDGNIAEANKNLGHNFSYSGTVVEGDKRGSKIGIPTVNLSSDVFFVGPKCFKICVRRGVYATRTTIEGKEYSSVTNVGVKPTVSNKEIISVESHLFNFSQNVYGKVAQVEFLEFIRAEKKFNSIEELVQQIKKDILNAQQILQG
jgi:riboflavin kinase/FMN adenylyltransferase